MRKERARARCCPSCGRAGVKGSMPLLRELPCSFCDAKISFAGSFAAGNLCGARFAPNGVQGKIGMKTGPVRSGWVYHAPPTICRFMASDAFGRLLAGPVGSGKTTGCIVETARRMGQQAPGNDGRKYTRFAIIRQSLKDAKATVLKDIRGWFGSMADWRVSESTLYIEQGNIYSEWVFIPLDEPDDVKRLLSLQLTAAYINECSETDIDLLSDIAGRVGRYPNNEFGACTWSGIYADTNMPIQHTPWADFISNPSARVAGVPPTRRAYASMPRTSSHLTKPQRRYSSMKPIPVASSRARGTTIASLPLALPITYDATYGLSSDGTRVEPPCSPKVSSTTSMFPLNR